MYFYYVHRLSQILKQKYFSFSFEEKIWSKWVVMIGSNLAYRMISESFSTSVLFSAIVKTGGEQCCNIKLLHPRHLTYLLLIGNNGKTKKKYTQDIYSCYPWQDSSLMMESVICILIGNRQIFITAHWLSPLVPQFSFSHFLNIFDIKEKNLLRHWHLYLQYSISILNLYNIHWKSGKRIVNN